MSQGIQLREQIERHLAWYKDGLLISAHSADESEAPPDDKETADEFEELAQAHATTRVKEALLRVESAGAGATGITFSQAIDAELKKLK